MSLLLIYALGIAAASVASMPASGYLRSIDERPVVDTDVKTLWDQLAAEAELMQVTIAEDRTTEDCINGCNACEECNRARCRRDCEDIADNGNDSDTRTMSCSDCRSTFRPGSNKMKRCLQSCSEARDRCDDAEDCDDCHDYCAAGARNSCLDKKFCTRCKDASDCNDCYEYCTGNARNGCLDSYSCTTAPSKRPTPKPSTTPRPSPPRPPTEWPTYSPESTPAPSRTPRKSPCHDEKDGLLQCTGGTNFNCVACVNNLFGGTFDTCAARGNFCHGLDACMSDACSSRRSYGANGEQMCQEVGEGQGWNAWPRDEFSCRSVGCCHWNNEPTDASGYGKCWSDVGTADCTYPLHNGPCDDYAKALKACIRLQSACNGICQAGAAAVV